jgi:hypothetical protein
VNFLTRGDVQQLQVDRIEDLWQEQKVVCGGCWKSQDKFFKPLDKQAKIKYEAVLKDYQAAFKAYEAECKTAAAASKVQAKCKKTILKPTKPKDLKPVARPSLALASTVSRELVAACSTSLSKVRLSSLSGNTFLECQASASSQISSLLSVAPLLACAQWCAS